MTGIEYFTSERFIHDDLLKQVLVALPTIYSSWRAKGTIEPFAITWPEETIRGDNGEAIEKPVLVYFEDGEDQDRALRRAVIRTKAYAVMLAKQLEDEVRLIFETKNGTQSWHFPIEKHGLDRVLGEVSSKMDEHSLGLLWKPTHRPGLHRSLF